LLRFRESADNVFSLSANADKVVSRDLHEIVLKVNKGNRFEVNRTNAPGAVRGSGRAPRGRNVESSSFP